MKRIVMIAAAALAAALLTPGGEGDVGDLIPVELLYVYIEEGNVCVETDTGQWGVGRGLEEALEDLRSCAPGEVFLETADYLVVTGDTVSQLPALASMLRPAARVCLGEGIDQQAAAFLSAHKPGVTLSDIRAGERKIPVLICTEGRYRIES